MAGNYRHGMAKTRIWTIYTCMKQRCSDKPGKNAKWYSGIKNEWPTFEEFYADMGKSYNDHVIKYGERFTTLERIDSNGNYCKENCRWATPAEQTRNSSQTRWITHKGRTQCMKDWSVETGIKYTTLKARLDVRGWPIEKALAKRV